MLDLVVFRLLGLGLFVLADLRVVVGLLIPVNSVVYLLLMWYVFIDGCGLVYGYGLLVCCCL